MFGLTPIKELQKEAIKEMEEDASPQELIKIKQIKLSLKNEKELRKHATYEQIENLRLRKNKRLLIIQISQLKQQLYKLGEEMDLIDKGNEELRKMSVEELSKLAGSVMRKIQNEKEKLEQLTKVVDFKQKVAGKAIENAEERLFYVNLVEKKQFEKERKIEKDKKFIKKQKEKIKNTRIKLLEQEKTQKLRQEQREIYSKWGIERLKQVDTIYRDIESKQLIIVQAERQLRADRESLSEKERQLITREKAVKDKEQSVRRLIQEVKRSGLNI